ncbi:hypothetical protein D3C85_349730 [compost metagenome]
MSLPIARLVAAAEARGLSPVAPILLSTDGGVAKQRVNIIVSHTEPVTVVAPLDLLWINPASNTTLRRVSRASSQAYTHTWTDATEANFWTPQIWDEPKPADQPYQELNRNVGNPFFLDTSDINAVNQDGGTMTGPLGLRVGASIDVYAENEAVPKSLVKKLTDTAQAVAASVNQQLGSIRSQLTALRTRMTSAEGRITTLENAETGPGGSTPSYKFQQVEAALEWFIEHNLNSTSIVAQIYLATGESVVPEEMESVDVNTYRVTFAEARAGTAVLVGIR